MELTSALAQTENCSKLSGAKMRKIRICSLSVVADSVAEGSAELRGHPTAPSSFADGLGGVAPSTQIRAGRSRSRIRGAHFPVKLASENSGAHGKWLRENAEPIFR